MVLHVRLRAATNCRRLPRSQTPQRVITT